MLLLNVAENNGKVEEVIIKHESNLYRSGFRAEKSAYFEVTIMLLLNVAENNGKVEEVINKHESNLHRSGFRSTFNLNSGGTH